MTDPDIGDERRVSAEMVPDGLTLAAFNTDCSERDLETLGETLGDYLDVRNVTVGTTVADDRDDEFAVLHDSELVSGALVHSNSGTERSRRAVSDAGSPFAPTDTLFLAGYPDREGLRTLSQRVETLAWRAGAGRLYVGGQQRLASMDDQWRLYESIADEGAEVHVFENESFVSGDPESFVVHEGHHALAGTWLVAFDGDGNDAAKAALVAVERDPDSYYGVWTVEPDLVDALVEGATAKSVGERAP